MPPTTQIATTFLDRRDFLHASAAFGAGLLTSSTASSLRAADGANEKLRVAVMGLSRGLGHVSTLLQLDNVEIAYLRDHAIHTLFFEQKGDQLKGSHRGEFLTGDIGGKVSGASVRCRGRHQYEGTSIDYAFEGVADGDTIRGTVDVGEYGKAPFTARRHFHA